jgi:hypothetical protein
MNLELRTQLSNACIRIGVTPYDMTIFLSNTPDEYVDALFYIISLENERLDSERQAILAVAMHAYGQWLKSAQEHNKDGLTFYHAIKMKAKFFGSALDSEWQMRITNTFELAKKAHEQAKIEAAIDRSISG